MRWLRTWGAPKHRRRVRLLPRRLPRRPLRRPLRRPRRCRRLPRSFQSPGCKRGWSVESLRSRWIRPLCRKKSHLIGWCSVELQRFGSVSFLARFDSVEAALDSASACEVPAPAPSVAAGSVVPTAPRGGEPPAKKAKRRDDRADAKAPRKVLPRSTARVPRCRKPDSTGMVSRLRGHLPHSSGPTPEARKRSDSPRR